MLAPTAPGFSVHASNPLLIQEIYFRGVSIALRSTTPTHGIIITRFVFKSVSRKASGSTPLVTTWVCVGKGGGSFLKNSALVRVVLSDGWVCYDLIHAVVVP